MPIYSYNKPLGIFMPALNDTVGVFDSRPKTFVGAAHIK